MSKGQSNPSFKGDTTTDRDTWPDDEDQGGTGAETTEIALDMQASSEASQPPVSGGRRPGEKKFSEEEEQILEVLRDVVRKCTNPDPAKRPTAAAVLELLNKCPVTVK